jgi:hypothetical protein
MGLTQGGDGRQSVQNIAHGTQANYEETKLGAGLQVL